MLCLEQSNARASGVVKTGPREKIPEGWSSGVYKCWDHLAGPSFPAEPWASGICSDEEGCFFTRPKVGILFHLTSLWKIQPKPPKGSLYTSLRGLWVLGKCSQGESNPSKANTAAPLLGTWEDYRLSRSHAG